MLMTLAERRERRESVPATAPEPMPPEGNRPAVAARVPTCRDSRQALTEKYRPRRLAEIVGQPHAVAQLRSFADAPYPAAFLFAGETGTGKTSAAWALGGDLGCNVDADPPEWGGVGSIPSGEHTASRLDEVWPGLWLRPFQSRNGWRVLIVNEVERLNGKVELLWLDKLEDLPPKLVVVFTTNDLQSLPVRFVDRCIGGVIEFESGADRLASDARGLAASIWWQETGEDCPREVLEQVVFRSNRAGRMSFRRVVQGLVPLLAAGRRES